MENIGPPLIEFVKEYGIRGVLIIVFVILAWRAIPPFISAFVGWRKDTLYFNLEHEKFRARIDRLSQKEEEEKKEDKQGEQE